MTKTAHLLFDMNQTVNGFLVLNKPIGFTSMEAVRRVKRLTGMRKRVGHGGTLDPLAEGILPICFGQATRLMEHIINETKAYRMKIHFGIATDTYDAEGEVTQQNYAGDLTREQVESALKAFKGTILQKPPMHSALKKEGRRLYELARKGVAVELEPREVQIHSMELIEFNLPFATIEGECGRGVYMRSLAHDLGQLLGCGAHIANLIRLRAGSFYIENAVSMDEFSEAVEKGRWKELIWPMDALLLGLKSAMVSKKAEKVLRNGQPISLGHHGFYAAHLERYRLYAEDGRFVGLARFDRSHNRWDPHKIFQIDEPSPHAPVTE